MSNFNLSQVVQTVANLSVIVGIVFLAMQLQQNSALLVAQARATRAQVRLDGLQDALSNPELLQAVFKQLNGQPVTDMEEFLLFIDANRSFVSWQFVYGEFREGLIESDDVPVENWRNVFRVRDLQRFWQQKEVLGLRPDFVQWMEANVVEQ